MSDFRGFVFNSNTDLSILLANIKRACSLWFRSRFTATEKNTIEKSYNSYDNITAITVQILRHGLRLTSKDAATSRNSSSAGSPTNNVLSTADDFKKLVEDFEWARRSAYIRDSFEGDFSVDQSTLLQQPGVLLTATHAVECFFHSWVQRNLRANRLKRCLQVLVAEEELLNTHYSANAFLRNEAFSTAFFMCLSAVELNQRILLDQIETKLYRLTSADADAPTIMNHRRTCSDPISFIYPHKYSQVCNTMVWKSLDFNIEDLIKFKQKTDSQVSSIKPLVPGLTSFRKTKSLPIFQHNPSGSRPQEKMKISNSKPILVQGVNSPSIENIPHMPCYDLNNSYITNACYSNSTTTTHTTSANGSSYSGSDDLALSSRISQNFLQMKARSPSSSHTPSVACSNITTACQIKLINCDDIKIWTDQAYDQTGIKRIELPEETSSTEACTIPKHLDSMSQNGKSSSPLSSFLCNIFTTPPTYTHWSILNQSGSLSSNATERNMASAAYPCSLGQPVADNLMGSSGGVFDAFMPVCGKKLRSHNSQSLFEDGLSTLDLKSTNHGPSKTMIVENDTKKNETSTHKPKCQQSLTDFLQTSQISLNNTDLEKENAHFRVSEAIISAIEHIKWDHSTEPEKKLLRRKETIPSNTATTAVDCLAAESNIQKNRSRTQFDTESYNESSEQISYAELDESSHDSLSAEVVGLALISKFNEKHLPKVSELKWLVSEEDTPQQLLPMPDSSPTANPDENVIRPMTRGTRYWAPPRQQIIFTNHPRASRKELIQTQNNRCAGCGMRISRQYMTIFRYCMYLGKYHCTGCHRNQISPIPAKILQSWDFKCYPVSVFSYRLLEQMYSYPLFYVPDLNPALYVDNKPLISARIKRFHLKFVKDFIRTCRFAIREHVYFESIPEHITNDPDIWSLSDFIDVHNKSMQRSIDQLIEKCEQHIFNCVLCTARGFHCEHCQKDQVIYPWQQKVFRCDRCGSCFHLSCWKLMSTTCCRCQRMSKRQEIS